MYRVIAFMTQVTLSLVLLPGCSTLPITWPPDWAPTSAVLVPPPNPTNQDAEPAPNTAAPTPETRDTEAPPNSTVLGEGPVSVTTATGNLKHHPELSPADAAEVRRLLQSARYALTDGLLVEPEEWSALNYYRRALQLDPANTDARYGIDGIVDRLVAEARAAAAAGDFAEARRVLASAALVDKEHPAVGPALNELELLEHAQRRIYRLDAEALAVGTTTADSQLQEAGRMSRKAGCRAIIYARNDAEGRTLYEMMSKAPGAARIRAELRIAASPRVETLCFEGAH
ncbi:MAG: tetratricopeptide repeat protein [Pseudomonadales bacterium]